MATLTMMLTVNIRCCCSDTMQRLRRRAAHAAGRCAGLLIVKLLVLSAAVFACPSGATAQAREHEELPDAAGVVSAYLTARQWVSDFALPGMDEPTAHHTIENATGICVIVRRGGRVLGTGIDHTGDELMLRRAVGRALSQVWNDEVVKRLPDSMRNALGPELVLELDVAGPLMALAGRTFEDVSRRLEPGLDGIAMRRGDKLVMRFPSQMIQSNIAGRVRELLPSLAMDLELTPRSLDRMRREDLVSVYRFRTTHLAQYTPSDAPIELFRGDEVTYLRAPVGRDTLIEMARSLQQHILTHQWAGDEPVGLMGDYLPTLDQHEPIIAAAADQAFAAFALARFAHTIASPDDQLGRMELLSPARDVLHALADRTDAEADPTEDVFASAMIIHAGLLNEMALAYRPARDMFDRAVTRVLHAWDGERNFLQILPVGIEGQPTSRPMPPPQQAVCASAIAGLARRDAQQMQRARINPRRVVDTFWSDAHTADAVNLVPWLVWAEQDLAAIGLDGPARVGERLDVLARALVESQTASIEPDWIDSSGGFPLSGRSGSLAYNAQACRAIAFLAMWSRDEAASEPAEARAAAHRAVRYLRQLMLGPSDAWRVPNINRASGGICQATWDLRQPLAGQAMALLALCELIETTTRP